MDHKERIMDTRNAYTSVSQPFRRRGNLDLALHISRYPLRKASIFLN